MDDFREMARDPEHRRQFEKLLFLSAKRGDADLVAERLSWGVDPNCRSATGNTPLVANVRGYCPSAETVRALLKAGADPNATDAAGLTAVGHRGPVAWYIEGQRPPGLQVWLIETRQRH